MTEPAAPVRRNENHIPFLDHLRGLAILLVFLFHGFLLGYANATPPAWSNFLPFVAGHPGRWLLFPLASGWVGVAIFFVISGFCIHLSHVRSRDRSWRVYFLRRFFRIYPPYLLALLFFAFILPVSRLAFQAPHVPRDLVVFLTHLTLTHNFVPASIIRINGAFWSIAVEVQLYLIYPLLLVLVRRVGWNAFLILALVLGVLLTHVPSVYVHLGRAVPWYANFLTKSPFAYWFSWALGARIADDWLERRPIFLSRFPLWITLTAFVLAVLFSDREKFAFLFGALAGANFIARYLRVPHRPGGFLTSRVGEHLRTVGLISYSLYLLHEPFLDLLPWLLGPAWNHRPLALMLLSLAEWPFILPVAWCFYRAVELPSIAWGKRVIGRPGTSRAPVAEPPL